MTFPFRCLTMQQGPAACFPRQKAAYTERCSIVGSGMTTIPLPSRKFLKCRYQKTNVAISRPCEATREQADVGDVDPGFCRLRWFRSKSLASLRHLPSHANVLSTTHLRGSTSKPLMASVTLDDLQCELADLLHCSFQLRSRIAAIGEDMAQPRPAFEDRFQEVRRAVTVLDIGGMDDETHQQAERVDNDMALAALDLLARVKATNSRRFRWSCPIGLSITPAVGLASLPSLSRAAITSVLLIVRSRPSSRQR